MLKKLASFLPHQYRDTAFLRFFGWSKVPLLGLVAPRVLELSDRRVEVVIPLSYWTKNHLGSMYFGALAIGADCAGGLAAMAEIVKRGNSVSLVFKDFRAEFLKRPEADVHFSFEDVPSARALVEKALVSGERVEMPVHVTATTPKRSGAEPVARFILLLSLKKKPSA